MEEPTSTTPTKKPAAARENRPHAVPVVVTKDDHTFQLDEEALTSVLLDERVRDKKVVLIFVNRLLRHSCNL